MLQKSKIISIEDFDKGLFTASNILKNERGQSPNCMNVRFNFDGSLQKRYGMNTQNLTYIGAAVQTSWIIETDSALTTGLQAYWKLNEFSGVRQDEFRNNSLGTINSPEALTGIRGNAAYFTLAGSMGLMLANTAPIQTGLTSWTIATWVYMESTNATLEQTIVSKRDASIDSATMLLVHGDGPHGGLNIVDSSPYVRTITRFGSAFIDTAQKVFGSASLFFPGSDGYLQVTDSDAWNLGLKDFTFDTRIRFLGVNSSQFLMSQVLDNDNYYGLVYSIIDSGLTFTTFTGGANLIAIDRSWSPNTATWYHVALVKASNYYRIYVDGVELTSSAYGTLNTFDTTPIPDISGPLSLAVWGSGSAFFVNGLAVYGNMDEIRFTAGIARWTSNFTVPPVAYQPVALEYWLTVNTDNQVTFRVSSSNLYWDGSVSATSHGVLAAGSWYSVVAWCQSGGAAPHIGVSVNRSVTTASYTAGVKIGSAPFLLGAYSSGIQGDANYFFNGRIDETGFWKKALSANERQDMYSGGSGNTFSKEASGNTWAMYDFGASSIRWLTIAAGTGIYASSNLGVTFVVAATTRTQSYQYFERSKNVLIATSDAYDPTLYWAGSVGTYFTIMAINSAPAVKYSLNHQGFLILLNSSARKRGFFYNDESTQLTSAWPDNFDIPSTADDEITAGFVLNRVLYVSTKYKIYRVSYLGGNPDWSYQPVATWGFVPRTVKVTTLQGKEVAIGLDWGRHLRAFGGTEDVILSDNVEPENGLSEFVMSKISFAGSGLIVSHAVVDLNEQEYRLCVSIGPNSTQTTHAIVFNLRNLAFYPYDNQALQCMASAESSGRTYLMAADRTGRVYILNTSNTDIGTPVNEYYESPYMFEKNPGVVQKSNKIDMYFERNSAGTLYYQDRADLSSIWSSIPKLINLLGSQSSVHVIHSKDIPSTQNIYQFKVMSSSSTANPWRLTHIDYFLQSMGIGKGD